MYFTNILIAFALSASGLVKAYGGFAVSCDGIQLVEKADKTLCPNPPCLQAQCEGYHDKTFITTNLPLDECLGNHNGQLVAQPNGGFGGSCSGCTLAIGDVLTPNAKVGIICNCLNNAHKTVNTNIGLEAGVVANQGGYLTCNGGKGIFVSSHVGGNPS